MLKGKVVLVTGASHGIGRAVYEAFARAGAAVYGTSRSATAPLLSLDVGDEASIQSAVQTILSREGRLDILVNNAGMGIAGALLDTSPDEFTRQMDINVTGVLRVSRACAPALFESRGMIINISSVAGFVPIPFQSGYSASKAAVESISACLRSELAPFGVRVCVVEPGDTKTDFTKNRVVVAGASPRYQARFQKSLARMEHDEQTGMSPDAVARVVLKLSDKKNPPVRVTCGILYKLLRFAVRILPDRFFHFAVGKLYG